MCVCVGVCVFVCVCRGAASKNGVIQKGDVITHIDDQSLVRTRRKSALF